jgi:hypothetical protein
LREETKDAKEMVLNKDIKEEYVKDYFKWWMNTCRWNDQIENLKLCWKQ